jgi:catechol 2,3-dioxygenase
MTPDALPYGLPPDGYRLPDGTHVGGVSLQIADLERSLDYYTGVIGLRVVARTASTATLAAHGSADPLVHLQAKPGVLPVPRGGANGLFHFAILLPDRAALGRFIVHAANTGARFGSADHAVSEAIYLHDPDGLGIEVYADRPRDTWRHAGRELRMGTEPLDFSAVIDAAGGQAWTGAPAGTTMGHMHLHVGDLEAARQFFHGALGFDITVWHYPGALFFSAGGYHHHLGTNTWATGHAEPGTHARLLGWEVRVPAAADADAAAARLREHGYQVDRRDGVWTAADPWGTQFTLAAGTR